LSREYFIVPVSITLVALAVMAIPSAPADEPDSGATVERLDRTHLRVIWSAAYPINVYVSADPGRHGGTT